MLVSWGPDTLAAGFRMMASGEHACGIAIEPTNHVNLQDKA